MLFEAPLGVSEIKVRHGFAQIYVSVGKHDVATKRIEVLRILAEAEISHKYLQLTQDGLALIITEAQVPETEKALQDAGVKYELNPGRSIVLVKANGLWEEKGMIASVVEAAIATGVQVDHVGDMHDRMYMVVKGEVAEETAEKFRRHLQERSG